jgi:hypothetical protein
MSTQSHIDKVNLQPMVMEYPAHVGAPRIEPQDLTSFKKQGLNKVDRVMKKRYDELVVIPTQKFDEKINEWVPDSYSLFIQIRKGSVILDRPGETESFLESLLGFECCVDFV